MQYTIRNVPPELDAALRERARQEGRSLNDVVVETLRRDLGLSGERSRKRDLSSFAGLEFIGDAAFSGGVQARFEDRILEVDVDGDGTADISAEFKYAIVTVDDLILA